MSVELSDLAYEISDLEDETIVEIKSHDFHILFDTPLPSREMDAYIQKHLMSKVTNIAIVEIYIKLVC